MDNITYISINRYFQIVQQKILDAACPVCNNMSTLKKTTTLALNLDGVKHVTLEILGRIQSQKFWLNI